MVSAEGAKHYAMRSLWLENMRNRVTMPRGYDALLHKPADEA